MKDHGNISPIRQKIEQIIFGFEQIPENEVSLVQSKKNNKKSAPTVPYVEQDSTAHVAFRSMN